MKKKILKRIGDLGGNIDNVKGNSLQDDLESIEFKNPLYPIHFNDEFYGIDAFYDNNKQIYSTNKQEFYINLVNHFYSDHEEPYGQAFYRKFLFTPFRENTNDFEELDGIADENEIRKVVNGTDMDFMCICYSYGFPDHYFICLTDPDQQNPTVYGTDHEEFFIEIENEGTLEEFFNRFLTKEEFLKLVKNYIDNVKTDK